VGAAKQAEEWQMQERGGEGRKQEKSEGGSRQNGSKYVIAGFVSV
jgi:hypothetical protein